MKSFVFWFIAALIAFSILKNHRRHEVDREPAHHRSVVVRQVSSTHAPNGHVLFQVDGDRANTYTITQLKDRYDDRLVFEFGDDDQDENGSADAHGRAPAEGLPVPIIPGSRVTHAKPEPPRPPMPPTPPRAPKGLKALKSKIKASIAPKVPTLPKPVETMTVTGRLSATEQRARNDAVDAFRNMLAEKLAPDVPKSWKIPSDQINRMILDTKITRHDRDYGTVFDASLNVDVSPARRETIKSAYHHEQVVKRLAVLGGMLGFVLTCLGAISGYIRADEATKGYYTNALRLAATVGIGGAGVAIYQALV